MGHVPADWEGAGRISSSVDTEAVGVDATSERVCGVDIPSPGGGNGGGGTVGDIKLRCPMPKQCRKVCCEKAN